MNTAEFKTFKVAVKNAQAWVTFDYEPVNIQGIPMLEVLSHYLEEDIILKETYSLSSQ
ncbi:hypothetical protein ATE84_0059 [Aquimarina sp. MAR_2010_214]|uniref:hypothetical protein n=1 Tax=Aquimarina sp. MAR_2010_214 TaxID=1250026 RepID=UPI000CB95D4D|nr:hypothetical protein [Aquimarina sp. MAR_2010_214]PKV48073.1 hypothetical protein ATE84_0059 [Aquimarina sp. MAR_2010_214]